MATIQQLETALRNADAKGDADDARKLAAVLQAAYQDKRNFTPDSNVIDAVIQAPEPTFTQQAVGAGETALALGTGATSGTIGLLGGVLKGIAEAILLQETSKVKSIRDLEKSAIESAAALTYSPRTEAGQDMTRATGQFLAENIPPFIPAVGSASIATRAALVPAEIAARNVANSATKATKGVVNKVKTILPTKTTPASDSGSVGAEAISAAKVRQANAEELGLQLTQGQRTRDFKDQSFENKTMKDPDLGGPIRERFEQQNKQLLQKMDEYIDQTGAELPDDLSKGMAINQPLRDSAAKSKIKIKILYNKAKANGELKDNNVELSNLTDFLNDTTAEAEVAKVLKVARSKAIKLGIASEDAAGELIAKPANLNNIELLRRSINSVTGTEPTEIKFATDLKKIIDTSTEGFGGDFYRQSRAARKKYARDFEDVGLVSDLMETKRGGSDRKVALERVIDTILSPSTPLDSVKHLRKLLQTEGPSGQQAWREIQGSALTKIRDGATKNVSRNQKGDPIISAAGIDKVITQLDKGGKLDFLFGKSGAAQVRRLNEAVKYLVHVPGTVNTSNNLQGILFAIDALISLFAGQLAPIATGSKYAHKSLKDAATKKKVQEALNPPKE